MNQKQFTFANEYLRHSNKIVAYTLAYGNSNNYTAVESAANRLLRTKEIADYIQQTRDSIRHQVEEEMKEKYKEELLTVYEKRLYIKKLLFGEIQVEIKYKGKNCTQCSHYMSPTIPMALNLLKEDSKLAGHYPDKRVKSHNISQQVEPVNKSPLQEDTETHREETPTTQNHNISQQDEDSPLGRGEGVGAREEHSQNSQNPEAHNISQQVEPVNKSPLQGDMGTSHEETDTTQDHNKTQQTALGMQVSESYHMVAQTAAKHAPNNNQRLT